MARRFLVAYGPARMEDFARWWGVRPKAVRAVFAAGDGFTEVEFEGRRMWASTAPVGEPEPDRDGPVVRLLPLFDPYTVAVRRGGDRPVAGAEKDLVYRTAGWISPVLLVDGEIAGVWAHTEAKGRVLVEIRPFAPLDPMVAERASVEAERLAVHLGGAVEVVFRGAADAEEP